MARRLALITGASAGIGAASARIYASHGYDVALTARRADRLEGLAAEIKLRSGVEAYAIPADLADPAGVDTVLAGVEAQGRVVDALINNAGYGLPGTYATTASYDSAISAWFSGQLGETFPKTLSVSATLVDTLRYGENPHQQAAVYSDGSGRAGVVTAKQLQGKELSYNNLNDTDAAFELVSEFDSPAVAIIKHANPCGVALGSNLGSDMISAYHAALACDPVSAFGGIIALNRTLDGPTAAEIIKIFSEVIIAPEISAEARAILADKKNVRVLETGGLPNFADARMTLKTISGGWLLQTADNGHITEAELQVVTDRAPTEQELKDLLFAFRVCKHVKSNAIVYAKGGKTVGIGAGQMSRIDSSRIAAWKAKEAGTEIQNSVVASDAFFPFPDGLLAAADAGATAVIQPGGSIKDKDVIAAANDREIGRAHV